MRITSGKYKGRIIKMPSGIRPTQDKVRQALFNILGDIEGLSFLELFAGSGAIGFEAVSRGVSELTLVECSRDCLKAISKNIEYLKPAACSIYPSEVDKTIKDFYRDNRQFDIIFLDPPYYKGLAPRLRSGQSKSLVNSLAKKTLQTLSAYDILTPNGFIIAQHFKKDCLPKKIGELHLFKEARYADTLLSFYRKVG
ncbi:MAG: 16S rRNA (guanine(966)-N(2))-methyltransferase RsmD [Candidatus Omnitrophota bacterium]|nr:MAG: 16S rRNA (guanine(966)-N(2))-methyltransferase RsmD [Candidatus Omnitrophota bacterium]